MLKSLKLERFKAFNNSGLIDIKPLTILCGTNSSGKSSILKSILLMKQSFENTSATNNITLNGSYTQNGKMEDVIYNKKGNGFAITTVSEYISPPKYNHYKGSDAFKQEVVSFKELKKVLGKLFYGTTKIQITVFVNVVCKGNQNSSANLIKSFSAELCCFDQNSNIIKEPIKMALEYCGNNKYNISLSSFPNESDELISVIIPKCACYFEGMKLVNVFAPDNQEVQFDQIFPRLYIFMRHAASSFKGISNISPLRHMPERYYFIQEDNNVVGQDGEYTPQVIFNNKDTRINAIAPPSGENYIYKESCDEFYDYLNSWGEYLGIGKFGLDDSDALLKLTSDGHSLADVGFGVSQVLPILTETLLLKKYQTLLIEQPEIHLHPKMQMRIADLFIATSHLNKNLIIETHSDHIVNRVLRRILEDKSGNLSQLISIYFVERTNEGSVVIPISIHPEYGFVDVPDDFFSQFSSETDAIFNACLNNKKG